MSDQYYVYMLASATRGTLYCGVTSNLMKRVYEHKHDRADGFTKRYGIHTLVWYEIHRDVHAAITREKQLKKWNRAWKLKLIEDSNPEWKDLYDSMVM